ARSARPGRRPCRAHDRGRGFPEGLLLARRDLFDYCCSIRGPAAPGRPAASGRGLLTLPAVLVRAPEPAMRTPRWLPRACLVGVLCGAAAPARAGAPRVFERDVRPVLKAHCFHCHGEEARLRARLDLRLVRTMRRGGVSGEAVVPGQREESLLW